MESTLSLPPTILIYGMPKKFDKFISLSKDLDVGLILDNGLARDPIFTFAENLSRADAIIAYPNAHPLHLVSLIAEAEVGHPLLQRYPSTLVKNKDSIITKPVVFFGSKKEWKPFQEQFESMRAEGLIRSGFDRTVHYESRFKKVIEYFAKELTDQIPATRLHYYQHSMKPADIIAQGKNSSLEQSPITISFFGSASSESALHLARADAAARMCARNNWNILHGGGDAGVMGQLTRSGKQYDAYVCGVSVDFSGAPKIHFERKDNSSSFSDHDYFIASKDMLHRIETYAGHSEAFVSLDGGIGSLQEILVISELLASLHPAVYYKTINGDSVAKPLYVVNESKIYDSVFTYLHSLKLSRLTNNIIEVSSIEELHRSAKEFFAKHPPLEKDANRKRDFRDRYLEQELPLVNLAHSIPEAFTKGGIA